MPNNTIEKIHFQYPKGQHLEVKDKSFTEAVKFVLNGNFGKVGTPIKITFPATNKILYFDDDYFRQFIQGHLSQKEVIELTKCDGLFRNKEMVVTEKKAVIDPQSLWKKEADNYTLVDNDNHIVVTKKASDFVEV